MCPSTRPSLGSWARVTSGRRDVGGCRQCGGLGADSPSVGGGGCSGHEVPMADYRGGSVVAPNSIHIPDGFGLIGFQARALAFLEEGRWEVRSYIGEIKLTSVGVTRVGGAP